MAKGGQGERGRARAKRMATFHYQILQAAIRAISSVLSLFFFLEIKVRVPRARGWNTLGMPHRLCA